MGQWLIVHRSLPIPPNTEHKPLSMYAQTFLWTVHFSSRAINLLKKILRNCGCLRWNSQTEIRLALFALNNLCGHCRKFNSKSFTIPHASLWVCQCWLIPGLGHQPSRKHKSKICQECIQIFSILKSTQLTWYTSNRNYCFCQMPSNT